MEPAAEEGHEEEYRFEVAFVSCLNDGETNWQPSLETESLYPPVLSLTGIRREEERPFLLSVYYLRSLSEGLCQIKSRRPFGDRSFAPKTNGAYSPVCFLLRVNQRFPDIFWII